MSAGFCFYNGGFDSDGFDTFLTEFKEASENHDIIHVFLETNGGNLDVAYSLASLFTNCDSRIVIHVTSECSSSGFTLLALVKDKCQIQVSTTAWSTVHLADITTSFKEREKDKEFYDFLDRKLSVINHQLYLIYEEMGFTKEELTDIGNFKDVRLNALDLARVIGVQRI